MSHEKIFLFGSFTEDQTRNVLERYHEEKCVRSIIRFGTLTLAESAELMDPARDRISDACCFCRPPRSDTFRPCSSDKIILFGSFTEDQTRNVLERYHEEKCVRSMIRFGTLTLAESAELMDPARDRISDACCFCRPPRSDAFRPCSSDKVSGNPKPTPNPEDQVPKKP